MAHITRKSPETAILRACPVCMASPQLFRAELHGADKWVIACPDCGYQMVGRRVEGLALAAQDLVAVTKPGDDFDEMVERWNAVPGKAVAR
jgi:hypothetical protein